MGVSRRTAWVTVIQFSHLTAVLERSSASAVDEE